MDHGTRVDEPPGRRGRRRRPRHVVVAALLAATAACGSPGGDDALSSPTSQLPVTSSTTTPPTTEVPTTAATSTTAPLSVVGEFVCPPRPVPPRPRADRPTHVLDVDVDVAGRRVTGTITSRFTPDLDTDRIEWRLWPNGPRPRDGGADLAVIDVMVDDLAAPHTLPSPTVLRVERALRAGVAVRLSVSFVTTLPGAINDRLAAGEDWVRLGAFHPTLEWEPGVGWNGHPPTSGFAEASLGVTADYEVVLDVPDGFEVIGTGTSVDGGHRWRAEAVREVAYTVGHFDIAEGTASAGRPVRVVVGSQVGTGSSAVSYRDKVVAVLEQMSQRYGAYPWPTYTLAVTPSLSGGIEHPMHVMQGPRTIGRTTSHEVAHMWFYGVVGNHQGRDPWIDEGLATWAEGVYEGTTGSILTRSIPAEARNRIGADMDYWEAHQSAYYRGVYVQGAQALGALGSTAQVDCALAHLVARSAYRVATPIDVLGALEVVFPDARPTLESYGARF